MDILGEARAAGISPSDFPLINGGESMALKASEILDDAAYVLLVPSAYEGFAASNPTVAFYLGLIAAGAFTLANRLQAQGY